MIMNKNTKHHRSLCTKKNRHVTVGIPFPVSGRGESRTWGTRNLVLDFGYQIRKSRRPKVVGRNGRHNERATTR